MIHPNDLVRKAKDRIFHLNCFKCYVCQQQLHTGDKLYVMADGSFVCKEDYLAGNHGNMQQAGRRTPSLVGETRGSGDHSYIFLPLINTVFLGEGGSEKD